MDQIDWLAIDYVKYFVPIFLMFIALESWANHYYRKKYNRIKDSMTSLSSGIMSQVGAIFSKSFFMLAYIYIEQSYGIFTFVDLSPTQFSLTVVALFLSWR